MKLAATRIEKRWRFTLPVFKYMTFGAKVKKLAATTLQDCKYIKDEISSFFLVYFGQRVTRSANGKVCLPLQRRRTQWVWRWAAGTATCPWKHPKGCRSAAWAVGLITLTAHSTVGSWSDSRELLTPWDLPRSEPLLVSNCPCAGHKGIFVMWSHRINSIPQMGK